MQFAPLGHRVLLERLETGAAEAPGGLVLPGDGDRPFEAVVIASGELCEAVWTGVHVLVSARAGLPLRLEGRDYLLVNSAEILGVTRR